MSARTYTDALTGTNTKLDGASCSFTEGPCKNHRASTVFFPGCGLLNNAQVIMGEVYDDLRAADPSCGISLLCCGRILEFEAGGHAAKDAFERKLVESFIEHRVKRIIAACPNCVQELRRAFARFCPEHTIEIIALPQVFLEMGKRVNPETAKALLDAEVPGENRKRTLFAMQDSCPDRATGEFAVASRALFPENMLVEKEHNRSRSLCCGSLANAAGNYDAGDKLARLHGEEGLAVGAHALVASCISCAHQLSVLQDSLPVFHYLELLYGKRVSWKTLPSPMPLRFLFEDLDGRRTYIGAQQ